MQTAVLPLLARQIALIAMMMIWFAGPAVAVQPDDSDLTVQYEKKIRPFLREFCIGCHHADSQATELDLAVFASTRDVAAAHDTWNTVFDRLESGEMPPEDAPRQPDRRQRKEVIRWIESFREVESARTAGDPGPVNMRRLSNAEYNYTVRDLTGIDIEPAATFPVDPANEAGFDNTGESLMMSQALLEKYLTAARQVVEHLVLKPDGFNFAPHPVMTETDRDKYCVNRIIEFYRQQPVELTAYFFAAWRFKHGADLRTAEVDSPAPLSPSARGRSAKTANLADYAAADDLSPRYLAMVWSTLTNAGHSAGPIATLRKMWHELPADQSKLDEARQGCRQMREFVVQLRERLKPQFDNLLITGSHKGSQPFVLWKNRQYAANRRTYDPSALNTLDLPLDGEARRNYEAAVAHFCSVFPDAFFVSERGRDYLDKPREEQERGRLLSAGFHSMMGYFRDDGPLYDLILTDAQQRELDTLWQELDFITAAPMRQYSGFLWFERTDSRYMRDPEFDFARAEDKNALSESMIKRLAEVYLAKARRLNGDPVAIKAIADFFEQMNNQIRWVERARHAAEPRHLEAMLEFARRAYRRNLSAAERDNFISFYHTLRKSEGRSHEEAVQDTLVSILVSPRFCFRVDLAASADGPRPLTANELANRLSYFLWSSMPDERLLDSANRGDLLEPDVLVSEAQRLLRDDRARGFVIEFFGNWLDFRRFEQHNSVDRERFPQFTDELRAAMFEEPVRFFLDLIQNDHSVLEMLHGNHTFVSPVLAKHYGIPEMRWNDGDNRAHEWRRVERVDRYGRGGLLPMSVFLTHNSPGLRTSPVKRGYWVVRRLLGERIPPPPPDVPELPADESQPNVLSVREMLARHRQHESCAGCHQRFDSIGLVFENYGPIGELRERDLGGRPVATTATFPGGSQGTGLAGLRHYLQQHREADFVENLCGKMLSYALGRTLQLSDEPLIEDMKQSLEQHHFRFSSLVESIVTSPQFLHKRGQVLTDQP